MSLEPYLLSWQEAVLLPGPTSAIVSRHKVQGILIVFGVETSRVFSPELWVLSLPGFYAIVTFLTLNTSLSVAQGSIFKCCFCKRVWGYLPDLSHSQHTAGVYAKPWVVLPATHIRERSGYLQKPVIPAMSEACLSLMGKETKRWDVKKNRRLIIKNQTPFLYLKRQNCEKIETG